jgi:hypothetical protein
MTRLARTAALFAIVTLAVLPLGAGGAAADSHFADQIDALKRYFLDVIDDLFPRLSDEVDLVTPPTPVSVVHGMESKSGSHFWAHLADAGYKLAAIDTKVGILPDVILKFKVVRELSEADRESLERKLEVDSRRVPGVVALAQRQIIRTLLEVSESGDMHVSDLKITLLPLPAASFSISPQDTPLDDEHQLLLRSILEKLGNDKTPEDHDHKPVTARRE